MNYREFVPSPLLKPYVRCVWRLTGASAAAGTGEPVIPDGCVEIVLNHADRMRRYHAGGDSEHQPARLLAGQLTRAITIGPTGRTDIWGIRFHPWAAAAFLGVSGKELRDQMLTLDVVPALDRLLSDLAAGDLAGDEATAARLFRALETRLRHVRPIDQHVPAIVGHVIAGGPTSIRGIAGGAGLSIRRVQTLFADHVGMSPKSLMRIQRFQRALSLSRSNPLLSWGRIAVEAGYYDHAHLDRDARAIALCSPTDLSHRGGLLTEAFIDN